MPLRDAASVRRRLQAAVAAVWLVAVMGECRAVEMFTFFGDGSRIGLPSLEVPIEAYPGIPLRSDRIRARRAARRPSAAVPVQQGLPRGITIREMPTAADPRPRPVPRPQPTAGRAGRAAVPTAPSPEDLLPVPEAVGLPAAR